MSFQLNAGSSEPDIKTFSTVYNDLRLIIADFNYCPPDPLYSFGNFFFDFPKNIARFTRPLDSKKIV